MCIRDSVQSDWNETDGNSDAFIKNKPAIPKAVTKTVQTLSLIHIYRRLLKLTPES